MIQEVSSNKPSGTNFRPGRLAEQRTWLVRNGLPFIVNRFGRLADGQVNSIGRGEVHDATHDLQAMVERPRSHTRLLLRRNPRVQRDLDNLLAQHLYSRGRC